MDLRQVKKGYALQWHPSLGGGADGYPAGKRGGPGYVVDLDAPHERDWCDGQMHKLEPVHDTVDADGKKVPAATAPSELAMAKAKRMRAEALKEAARAAAAAPASPPGGDADHGADAGGGKFAGKRGRKRDGESGGAPAAQGEPELARAASGDLPAVDKPPARRAVATADA